MIFLWLLIKGTKSLSELKNPFDAVIMNVKDAFFTGRYSFKSVSLNFDIDLDPPNKNLAIRHNKQAYAETVNIYFLYVSILYV